MLDLYKFRQRKRLCSLRKQRLHPSPDGTEQFGLAVALQAVRIFPMAQCCIDEVVPGIFQQLKACTSFEIPDGDFVRMEDLQEFFRSGFGEVHANDSDDHAVKYFSLFKVVSFLLYDRELFKDDVYDAVIIQSQQFRGIPFVNSDFKKMEAVEDNEAFSLLGLVVGRMHAPEFFAAELDRV